MVESAAAHQTTSLTHVDMLLFRVRWILWALVIPIAWMDAGGLPPPATFWAWVLVVAAFNLLIGLILHSASSLATRLAVPTLILDSLCFGLLPFFSDSRFNLLAFFAIFPALIAAIRFGPQIGLSVAALLSIALGVHTLLPIGYIAAHEALPAVIPIVTLLAAAALVGYLSKHEREAALSRVTQELNELRGAVAGAKMFYRTADAFNLTTSYKTVMEAMLEAGVKGLPEPRREDGPPVGIALFFEQQATGTRLSVGAARNLTPYDEKQSIAGQAGIVGEALRNASEVVFERVDQDPELSVFSSLQRCRSGVCYPLQAGLEQYGVVILATPAPRPPAQQHLELMRAFTSQAGVAFQNARLYQVTRQEQDRIIRNESELRQKLARDLHDGPTQKVAALVMQLDYIARLIEQDPLEAKVELQKARQVAEQTVREIRTALFSLRPLALESKGLSAALEQYAERLRETENVAIQLEPGDFGTELDSNIAVTVFAIIEEAVNNARKHAGQSPILVSVQRKKNSLIAIVQDQGPGFDVDQVVTTYDERSSLGLQNMRERAKLIDGELRIDSAPGQGTRVTLAVALPPPILLEKPL